MSKKPTVEQVCALIEQALKEECGPCPFQIRHEAREPLPAVYPSVREMEGVFTLASLDPGIFHLPPRITVHIEQEQLFIGDRLIGRVVERILMPEENLLRLTVQPFPEEEMTLHYHTYDLVLPTDASEEPSPHCPTLRVV